MSKDMGRDGLLQELAYLEQAEYINKQAYSQLKAIVEQHFGDKLIIFGDGTYGVAHGAVEGNPTNELIIYKLDKPIKPVGKSLEGYVGKTTDEIDTMCRLFFKNPESAQVMIDGLFIIKNKLIEWEQTNEAKE